ncbi:MAG TPA: hypothetical protein VF292_03120 [Rhodanobacteraceae bacterium]
MNAMPLPPVPPVPADPFAMVGGLADVIEQDVEVASAAENRERELEEPDSLTPEIVGNDFDSRAQRYLFHYLNRRVHEACNVDVPIRTRAAALEWCFVPGKRGEDKAGVEFDATCYALGCRPFVLRARIQHQFWRSGVVLSGPLPFAAVPLPESIGSEIEARVGIDLPRRIVAAAWAYPSIPGEVLRAKFASVDAVKYRGWVDALMGAGYLGIATARAYCITRNPGEMSFTKRSAFSFSGSLHGEGAGWLKMRAESKRAALAVATQRAR